MSDIITSKIKQLKANITEINCDEAFERFKQGTHQFIDVRTLAETAHGAIKNAHIMGRDTLEWQASNTLPLNTPIIVYCKSGGRSLFAAQSLIDLGYSQVCSLDGGYDKWQELNLPIETK